MNTVLTGSPHPHILISSKGIFHTDRPAPQTHLSQKLSALLMRLPIKLFVPFLTAFYTTMSTNYSYIPSLRLDKYLYLIRCYVSSAFYYLSMHRWSPTLRSAYLTLMQGPVGPLSRGVGDEAKVPDGLRYHVLDIWVEELVPVLEEDEEDDAGELLMKAVRSLEKEGRGKALRKKAKESLEEWEKCVADGAADAKIDDSEKTPVQNPPHVPGDDEWEGFGN